MKIEIKFKDKKSISARQWFKDLKTAIMSTCREVESVKIKRETKKSK